MLLRKTSRLLCASLAISLTLSSCGWLRAFADEPVIPFPKGDEPAIPFPKGDDKPEESKEEEKTEEEKKPVEAPKPVETVAPKAVNPGDVMPPDQAIQKAKIEIDRKRYGDAKLALKQSLQGNPKHVGLYMTLYDACLRSNDWSDAAYSLEKVMEIDPSKEKDVYGDYGQTLYHLKRYDKAKAVFEKALTYGKDKEGIRKTLIKIATYQKDAPFATTQYKEYLKLKPNDGDMHWEYANFLYREGKIKESLPEYKLASDNRPNDTYGHERYAYLLLVEKDYEGSINAYKRALSTNSDQRLKDGLKYAMQQQKQAQEKK